MDSAEKKRKSLLGAALLVTLLAVVLVEDEEEETIVDSMPTMQPTKASSGNARDIDKNTVEYLVVDQLGQRKFNAEAGELFKSTSWIPQRARVETQQTAAALAKQAAQAAAPPPAPTPPPLQFKYIGKAIAENRTWVFLSQAGENHIAKLGERIDDQYRVDAVNDEAVTFTYLPLNAKQTLTINNNKIAGNIR